MINQRARARLVALAVLLTAVAVGCSSTGDGAIPVLETTLSSEPTSTEVEETTTTTAETTTSTTETTTTETEAPLRPELDPANWNSDLDEIFGRYLLYWQALDAAYSDPQLAPDYEALEGLLGPEALADARSGIEEHQAAGKAIVFSEDSLEEHVLRLPRPTSLTKIEGNEVIIQDCWISDSSTENSHGTVLETSFYPTMWNATMRVIDGEWRVLANVVAADGSDGWDECNKYYANLDQ